MDPIQTSLLAAFVGKTWSNLYLLSLVSLSFIWKENPTGLEVRNTKEKFLHKFGVHSYI